MSFWFRDIISEGKKKYKFQIVLLNNKLNIAKAISDEQIKYIKDHSNINTLNLNKNQLGHYLAGLLEGDGHISLPFLGNTILNRILNPRIIFTSHINNLPLYIYIQSLLGGVGRFQFVNNNIRYIIGDVKGITLFINTVHNKLRTPKNITFNKLIEFFNNKYFLSIESSKLDTSNILNNYWFSGFTEADGSFQIKIVDSKPKSETRKRSVSENISLRFRLDQRLHDKPTSSTMLSIMEEIAKSLSSNLNIYKTNKGDETLSITVTSIDKLKTVIDYFYKYPLLGTKCLDFIDWKKAYFLIISKDHLTEAGRLRIKLIKSKMNKKRI